MSNWRESDEWREKEPTKKQSRKLHWLLSRMIENMSRGETSDFIERLENTVQKILPPPISEMSEEEYDELREDLVKKKRSWKWKEDLR